MSGCDGVAHVEAEGLGGLVDEGPAAGGKFIELP